MLEAVILGIVQGVSEWIPISSEAAIIFIKNTFFQTGFSLEELVKQALFLHLGTFFAALIYFRKEVKELFRDLFFLKEASQENKKIIGFLVISTLFSGLFGIVILKSLSNFQEQWRLGGNLINILIALLLLITAVFQIKASKREASEKLKGLTEIKPVDGIILGLAQGLSVLPGLSRSGLTVSALLLRKFDDTVSLKLSFLMSLPIVFIGNITLNLSSISLSINSFISLLFAFIAGLFTINLLLKFSQKINFAHFVLFFSLLVLIATFI